LRNLFVLTILLFFAISTAAGIFASSKGLIVFSHRMFRVAPIDVTATKE